MAQFDALQRKDSLDSPDQIALQAVRKNSLKAEPSIPGRMRDFKAADDDQGHCLITKDAQVLLIVTGGTLCMVNTDDGYMPVLGLHERLKESKVFYDEDFCKENQIDDEWLVTPMTPYKSRIRYKVLEFETLIDSSNVTLQDQAKIA